MFKGFFDFILRSPSIFPLILVNIITIVFALIFQWGVIEVMCLYLIQSIIIGGFNFLKMIFVSSKLKDVSIVMGLFFSLFFLVHYGIFHLVYSFILFSFLFSQTNFSWLFSLSFIIAVLAFLVNHLFSFVFYSRKAVNYSFSFSDVHRLMSKPYLRIIPMHLTIIFGGMFLVMGIFNWAVLLFFMILKTVIDVKMHLNEHKDELV